jgi:hypothetical protein
LKHADVWACEWLGDCLPAHEFLAQLLKDHAHKTFAHCTSQHAMGACPGKLANCSTQWRNCLEHWKTQELREPGGTDPVQHSACFTLVEQVGSPGQQAKWASWMMFFIGPAKLNEDDISNNKDDVTLCDTPSLFCSLLQHHAMATIAVKKKSSSHAKKKVSFGDIELHVHPQMPGRHQAIKTEMSNSFFCSGKTSESEMHHGGCIFADCASANAHVESQQNLNAHKTLQAKELCKLHCALFVLNTVFLITCSE